MAQNEGISAADLPTGFPASPPQLLGARQTPRHEEGEWQFLANHDRMHEAIATPRGTIRAENQYRAPSSRLPGTQRPIRSEAIHRDSQRRPGSCLALSSA